MTPVWNKYALKNKKHNNKCTTQNTTASEPCLVFAISIFKKSSKSVKKRTQSAFTFSKLTIETLEEGAKYVQSL